MVGNNIVGISGTAESMADSMSGTTSSPPDLLHTTSFDSSNQPLPSISPPQIRNVIRPSQGYNNDSSNSSAETSAFAPSDPMAQSNSNSSSSSSGDPNLQLTPRQEFWERVEAEHHAKSRVLILKQYCTEERLAEMGLEDLTQIVHSFAEARYPDHQLFGLISTKLQDVVRRLKSGT
jgi:hypothetical protein